MAGSSWFLVCSLEKIAQPPHCFLIRVSKRGRLVGVAVGLARARPPLHQPGNDRKRWSMSFVGEPSEAERLAEAGRCVEHGLGGVHRDNQPRTSSRDYDARGVPLDEHVYAHL